MATEVGLCVQTELQAYILPACVRATAHWKESLGTCERGLTWAARQNYPLLMTLVHGIYENYPPDSSVSLLQAYIELNISLPPNHPHLINMEGPEILAYPVRYPNPDKRRRTTSLDSLWCFSLAKPRFTKPDGKVGKSVVIYSMPVQPPGMGCLEGRHRCGALLYSRP